jgi:hypothetical protein
MPHMQQQKLVPSETLQASSSTSPFWSPSRYSGTAFLSTWLRIMSPPLLNYKHHTRDGRLQQAFKGGGVLKM